MVAQQVKLLLVKRQDLRSDSLDAGVGHICNPVLLVSEGRQRKESPEDDRPATLV